MISKAKVVSGYAANLPNLKDRTFVETVSTVEAPVRKPRKKKK